MNEVVKVGVNVFGVGMLGALVIHACRGVFIYMRITCQQHPAQWRAKRLLDPRLLSEGLGPPGWTLLPLSAHATFALEPSRYVCRRAQVLEEDIIGTFTRPKPWLQKEASKQL